MHVCDLQCIFALIFLVTCKNMLTAQFDNSWDVIAVSVKIVFPHQGMNLLFHFGSVILNYEAPFYSIWLLILHLDAHVNQF